MRKIIVISMISLDGVIQAPGGPEEDKSDDFIHGGWVIPYGDKIFGEVLKERMKPADLLLGRFTFEIWENYWPEHASQWPGINEVTKYVLSKTRRESTWKNTVFIETLEDIRKLKLQGNSETNSSDIKVWGSSELVQLLLKNDLVDELWLSIYPIILGKGKKLFGSDARVTSFKLVSSTITTTGVILANYERDAKDVNGGYESLQ